MTRLNWIGTVGCGTNGSECGRGLRWGADAWGRPSARENARRRWFAGPGRVGGRCGLRLVSGLRRRPRGPKGYGLPILAPKRSRERLRCSPWFELGRRCSAGGSTGSPAAEGAADPVERPWGCGSRRPDPAYRCAVGLRRRTWGQGGQSVTGGELLLGGGLTCGGGWLRFEFRGSGGCC